MPFSRRGIKASSYGVIAAAGASPGATGDRGLGAGGEGLAALLVPLPLVIAEARNAARRGESVPLASSPQLEGQRQGE